MADLQDPPSQSASTQTTTRASPPLTPPDYDPSFSDHKQSRKREREVSLEPANTPKALDAEEATGTEQRDTRTPAKRNRRTLETTTEETDEGMVKNKSKSRSRSHSVSPPIGIGVSPRQEIRIKVRQISQGVEDLTWKTPKPSDKTELVTEINASSTLAPPLEVDEVPFEGEDTIVPDVQAEIPQPNAREQPSQEVTEDQLADKNGYPEPAPVAVVDAAIVASVHQAQAHVRSQSEGGEKGLKRRYEERGTSQGPSEEGVTSTEPSEPLKRPRDDQDQEDPNPRETKRQSPPPETKTAPNTSPPSPKPAAKPTGFLAYATTSPFAAVKGPNIFSSGKNTPMSAFSTPPPSTPQSSLGSISGGGVAESSTSPPKNLKRSGFEAFASSSSPFASAARSRSPVLGQTSKLGRAKSPPARSNSVNSNPFASYLGNSQGFVVPAQKRARADSPPESSRSSLEANSTLNVLDPNRSESPEEEEEDDRQRSFGEKLRATRDDEDDSGKSEDEPKISLTEQEVITGEEDDRILHQVRSKLYSLDKGQWKERGTGLMKLNVKRYTGGGARLVMRKEAVHTLLLNVALFPGMLCMLAPQDPRYLRFSAIEDGSTTHYNLRLGNAKAAQDLLDKILDNIPPAQ